jgi:CheY-like chemotaxis protein
LSEAGKLANSLPIVVIADDQPAMQLLLRATFDLLNVELQVASNGTEALALCAAHRPQLLVCDVMMPGGPSGMDVCRQLRADPANAGLRIILVTARGQRLDVAEGLSAGADHYLVKPFSPLALAGLARQMLGLPSAP